MKYLIRTLALILTTLIFITGCSKPIEQGEVVSMRIEEESNNLVLIPMKVGNVTIMQQYWVFDDKDWVITIEGRNEDNEIVRDSWYITEAEYNQTKIGDYKNFSTQYAKRNDEHVKTKKEG